MSSSCDLLQLQRKDDEIVIVGRLDRMCAFAHEGMMMKCVSHHVLFCSRRVQLEQQRHSRSPSCAPSQQEAEAEANKRRYLWVGGCCGSRLGWRKRGRWALGSLCCALRSNSRPSPDRNRYGVVDLDANVFFLVSSSLIGLFFSFRARLVPLYVHRCCSTSQQSTNALRKEIGFLLLLLLCRILSLSSPVSLV